MARRLLILMSLAGAILLFSSAVALAAVRTGTAGSETLPGTPEADRITGRGGDDRTVGKAGNDTYFYADGWGRGTVVDSRGVDTLNFSAVTGPLLGSLRPEFSGTDARGHEPRLDRLCHLRPPHRGHKGRPRCRHAVRLRRQEHDLRRRKPDHRPGGSALRGPAVGLRRAADLRAPRP